MSATLPQLDLSDAEVSEILDAFDGEDNYLRWHRSAVAGEYLRRRTIEARELADAQAREAEEQARLSIPPSLIES